MDFGPDAGASSQAYHPGQAGTLRLGPKNILASFGTLHPMLAKSMALKAPAVAGELYLDAVPMKPISDHRRPAFAPSALQAVTRDFAFILDESVAAADLVRAVKGADKALIVAARIFDRFAGDTLGEGKVSLAVEVTLQPRDASLTEAELKTLADKIVAAAGKLGASLRG
jgi:phenylalanyl-tRNA synthetase beta chain